MKRILHIITTIEPGGAEKQLLVLSKAQSIKGDKVSVIYLKGEATLKNQFEQHDVEVITKLSNRSFVRQILLLRKLIDSQYRFDVIHAHLPQAELLLALTKKNSSNLKVITKHNIEQFYPRGPKLLSLALGRFVSRQIPRTIAISHAVKDYYSKSCEMNSCVKIKVVHYGLDITENVSISDRKNQNDFYTFGTISRHVNQKNLETLIMAFAEISDHKIYKLIIVGSGPKTIYLQNLASSLEINDHITWVPRITNVQNFYKSIDCFVLSSLYEGFGLVLLEAMLSNVPIIASRAPAIPEVLGDDYPNLFQPKSVKSLAENMIKMSESSNLKLIGRNLQRLNNFSTSKMLENTYIAYKELSI